MKNRFGYVHFSTGDLLRAEVKKQTDLGKEIDSYISKGNLVPGEVAVNLIKKNILEKSKDFTFIIDGYPRNQSNIDKWEEVVKDEIDVLGCLYLDCSEETMKSRILKRAETSDRSDDNEEVFKNRIKVFHEKTKPILSYFEKKNNLFNVSAEGSKDECFQLVVETLKKLGIDKEEKVFLTQKYLNEKVDKFVKPMIIHLMKKKPENVLECMKEWIDTEGVKIQQEKI